MENILHWNVDWWIGCCGGAGHDKYVNMPICMPATSDIDCVFTMLRASEKPVQYNVEMSAHWVANENWLSSKSARLADNMIRLAVYSHVCFLYQRLIVMHSLPLWTANNRSAFDDLLCSVSAVWRGCIRGNEFALTFAWGRISRAMTSTMRRDIHTFTVCPQLNAVVFTQALRIDSRCAISVYTITHVVSLLFLYVCFCSSYFATPRGRMRCLHQRINFQGP